MICPIDKVMLIYHPIHDRKIYYCKKCLGLWIEKQTLVYLTDLFLEGEFPEKIKSWSTVQTPDMQVKKWEEDILACPNHTSHKMQKHYYSGDSKVLIDMCGLCQGFWIDGHEIKKLYDYFSLSSKEKVTIDFFKFHIREEIRLKKEQEEAVNFISNFLLYSRDPRLLLLFLIKTLVVTVLEDYGYKK